MRPLNYFKGFFVRNYSLYFIAMIDIFVSE